MSPRKVIELLGGRTGLIEIARRAREECFVNHQESVIRGAKDRWKSDGDASRTNRELAEHLGISEAEASQLETRLPYKRSSDADDILRRLGVDPLIASPQPEDVVKAVMRSTLAAALEVRRNAGEVIPDVDLSDEVLTQVETFAGEFLIDIEKTTDEDLHSTMSRIRSLIEMQRGLSDRGIKQQLVTDWSAIEAYLPYQLAILVVLAFQAQGDAAPSRPASSATADHDVERVHVQVFLGKIRRVWPKYHTMLIHAARLQEGQRRKYLLSYLKSDDALERVAVYFAFVPWWLLPSDDPKGRVTTVLAKSWLRLMTAPPPSDGVLRQLADEIRPQAIENFQLTTRTVNRDMDRK